MTISSTTRKAGPFDGNGVTTSFPFTFKVFAKSDLEVVRTTPSGLEETLVLNSDYSVTLNADQDANPGGTITYPVSGTPLPTGWRLTAVGDLDNLQPTDITNGGGFYPQVIENALDRVTMLLQQLDEEIDRTIRIAVSDDVTDGLELPAQAGRAARLLGFDADGNFTTYERTTATVQTTYRQFTATAGQTSFTLPNSYTPGANSLYVWLNGAKLISGTDFTETTATSFTLTTGAQAGDSIEAIAGVPLANGTVADASQISYTPSGGGAVGTNVQEKLRRSVAVSPVDFGAVGDGITDDSAAFSLLNGLPAGTLVEDHKYTFAIKNVNLTTRLDIANLNIKHLSGSALTDFMLKISADNTVFNFNVDMNSQNINAAVQVIANKCRGHVYGKNMIGSSSGGGTQSLFDVIGNNNTVSVEADNFLLNGASNPSVPRAITTSGTATGTHIKSIVTRGVQCFWVNGSTGKTHCDFISSTSGRENGLYDITAGSQITIGTAVFQECGGQTLTIKGNCKVGDLIVRDCTGSANVDEGGNIEIGNYSVSTSTGNHQYTAMLTRSGTTNARIKIGRLSGEARCQTEANGASIFQFFAGTVDQFEIGFLDYRLFYKSGDSLSIHRNDNGKQIIAGDLNIEVVDADGSLTGSSTFTWTNPTYTDPSTVGTVRFHTDSAALINFTNAAQSLLDVKIAEIQASSGILLKLNQSAPHGKMFISTEIPTAGTYNRGDMIINKFATSTGVNSWICVNGGTPGTWRVFSYSPAKAATASRPTLSASEVGVMHLDTTLDPDGKPIWWTGTAWVDATGVVV